MMNISVHCCLANLFSEVLCSMSSVHVVSQTRDPRCLIINLAWPEVKLSTYSAQSYALTITLIEFS